jgi:pyridoxamine 5'-phosphate oxidase
VPDRAWLEMQVAAVQARFASDVPRPSNWGGIRVVPSRFALWQGRESSLHDRRGWTREGDRWTIGRLAP